jgi:cytochrome d ubiquinol oxidase subunit I
MSVGAYYILRQRHVEIARRSLTVAASFGLASALSVVVLGDESGYTTGESQKMKIAAIEAMWETEPPPASFTLFGIPDLENETTRFEVRIPFVLGLIATRSLDKPVEGIKPLVERNEARIRNGLAGYKWIAQNGGHAAAAIPPDLEDSMRDVGHSLLLKRFRPDIENATADEIDKAAHSTIPDVPVLFWSFRIMVALGFYFIALFGAAFYFSSLRRAGKPWFLRLTMYSLPLPWIAAELGWIVAETGRQPWIIDSVMPTFLGVSSVPAGNVAASLAAFVLFYTALAVVDVGLILKYVRKGPHGPADAAPQAGPPPEALPAYDASR